MSFNAVQIKNRHNICDTPTGMFSVTASYTLFLANFVWKNELDQQL